MLPPLDAPAPAVPQRRKALNPTSKETTSDKAALVEEDSDV